MVARRGWSQDKLSDNSIKFIGGFNEINHLLRQIDQDKVQMMMSNNGIDWHWNPHAAPHFGGSSNVQLDQ